MPGGYKEKYKMVEMKKIFDGKKRENKEDMCKSVKEFSEKIGEYPNTSTFITVGDAIKAGSDIFIIRKESDKKSDIQRDFVIA